MKMKRRAILVACNGDSTINPQKILKGTTTDIESWYTMLQTPHLGSWEKDEIIVLKNKNAILSELRSCIEKSDANFDYLFFAFSGHGCIKKNQSSEIMKIQLHDGEIDENVLYSTSSRCKRKTIYFDCCKKIEDISLIRHIFAGKKEKERFISLLRDSPEGIVKVYSSSRNQEASDSPSFTESLMKAIGNIIENIGNSKKNFYPIQEVVDKAKSIFPNFNKQQPEYSPDKNVLQFPFII